MEWLAKKVVAGLVNRFFGDYLEDLNTQEVNDALLSGQVNLSNLRIRHDALSFLDILYGSPLPIEVKKGSIGRISLTIPYSSFFTQPVVINVEDVFLLVTPVVEYDEEREKDLDRARKRQVLAHLFPETTPADDSQDTNSIWGLLYNRIWNNLELHINNVHIRYEDTHSCPSPLVIGLCLQSLSADTTNHKWKKAQIDGNAATVNKVVDFVSASLYINPGSERQRLVKPHTSSELWHQYLQQGLNTFSINEEPFQFVLQPVRCKVKMRQQMKREARVPGLLVDAVVRDAALTLSHRQYIALTELSEAFTIINTSRRFLKYQPLVPLKRHAAEWWQYAATAIIEEQIRPFSWTYIKKHRVVTDLEEVEAYTDDIFIYDDTRELHLKTLRAFFDTLARTNPTINSSNSEFGHARAVSLDHVVSQGQMDHAAVKITVINEFPVPTCKKTIRKFLGMAGYYKRFCRRFSDMETQLIALLCKKNMFKWTDACQIAFQEVKRFI